MSSVRKAEFLVLVDTADPSASAHRWRAVLLVAGDGAGRRRDGYRRNIPVAERRYARWLDGEYDEEG